MHFRVNDDLQSRSDEAFCEKNLNFSKFWHGKFKKLRSQMKVQHGFARTE